MVAAVPNPPAETKQSVDSLCHANGEALDAAPEREGAVAFHHEMDVIELDAEVQQTKAVARSTRESGTD